MTQLFKPSLFLNRLVIKEEQYIVYDEKFHKGVNIIRGDNSSGKSTIMELIFFALGGVIPKKQWKEKALLCSEVYAEVQINERIFTLQRNITDNSQEGMRIFEGKYENFLIKESLHFPFNSNANANKESFHDNLLSLLGIPKSKSDNSNSINFNQILRLIYTDQLTSVSRIFREQEFDSNLIREAIGDLLLGISSGELLSKKIEFKNLNKKLDTAIDEVKIVLRISGEILTKEHFQEQIENNKIHIDKLNELLEKIDDDIPDTDKEKIIEYEAQNHIINLLDTYVKDPKNKYSVIPAMLSADGEKGGAISAYNEALMERDKITKSTNSVNPLSEIADSQIDKLRDGVVLAIDNARKSSQFVLNDLKSQEKAIMSKMDYVPTYEREYLDYKRQQEILQGVYLILLQKREEVALSLGQGRDKGFIVDAAVAKYRPVAPRKLFAVLGFLILTIVIPMGYLFAKQQLRDLIDIYKRK